MLKLALVKCNRLDTVAEYCRYIQLFIKVLMLKLKIPPMRGYRAGPSVPAPRGG